MAAVREALETLGYSVFDECKDGCDLGGKYRVGIDAFKTLSNVHFWFRKSGDIIETNATVPSSGDYFDFSFFERSMEFVYTATG